MNLTALIFLAGFVVVSGLTLTRSAVYGLYGYVALFYLHPPDRWWGAALPDVRWHLVTGAITLVAVMREQSMGKRPAWAASPAAVFLMLMCGWLWVQSLWALSPESHSEAAFLFTKYLVLLYLMHCVLKSEQDVWGFLQVHVMGCLYLGWLVMQAPDAGRLEGVGGPGINEANALGMQIATGVVGAAALLMRPSRWSRAIAVVSLPLIGNALVQTESRGAFLAVVAGALVMLKLSPTRVRWRLVALGLAGMMVVLPMVPGQYWDRLGTISTVTESDQGNVEGSISTRLSLFRAQWKMFKKYPLGVGHRGVVVLSPNYLADYELSASKSDPTQRSRSSHNTFMTALTEQGVPGALLMAWICLWIARSCRSLAARSRAEGEAVAGRSMLVAATGGMLAVVLVAGMFTDYFKAEVFIWGLGLLSALVAMSGAGERSTAAEGDQGAALAPSTR